MARSISPASRMLIGLTSTLSDGATAWMTANWPVPGAYAGSRRTASSRHVRRDLLEQFQPFPGHAEFELHEAGGVAARPRQAVDEAGGDRIDEMGTRSERCGSPAATAPWSRRRGQDHVRCERGQFRRVLANVVRHRRRPGGCRSARCGRWSSPIAASPAGTPRHGPEFRIVRGRGPVSTPMRRTRSGCCARAASGHAAAPPRTVMKSRRLIRSPRRRGRAASDPRVPLSARTLRIIFALSPRRAPFRVG